MSFPGAIERPLLPDEFSVYFASRDPIPLATMATFLRKIDTLSETILEGSEFYLELSEYASGSGEPRFRIVKRGRASLNESIELQRRAVEAAERQATAAEKQLWWTKAGLFGATLVGPIAGAVAGSLVSGLLNPSTKTIIRESNVTEVVVRAPEEICEFIPASKILEGHQRPKAVTRTMLAERELERLDVALREGTTVRLAGRGSESRAGFIFRTLSGNRLKLLDSSLSHSVAHYRQPLVIEAVVIRNGKNWVLDPLEIITPLDDF